MIHYLNLPSFEEPFKQRLQRDIEEIYWNNFTPLSSENFLNCYPLTSKNFIGRSIIGSLDNNIVKYLTEYLRDNSNISLIKQIPLNFGVVLLKNLNTGSNAFFPPHTDTNRDLGINIILEKGGDDACLELYETNTVPDHFDDVYKSSYWNHNNLKISKKENIDENVWHSFQASNPHGVTGIQTRRTTLMMRFPFNSYRLFLTRKEFFIL
jgi:hypothetical protein